jgi:choline dehydrogenase-like flavoprotein
LPAKKSFIISGGVFNSLQLLELSGIGPKAELESFNILLIVDLPGVGSSLQDNTESGLNIKSCVVAFRKCDIFMRGSPSGARGFWPLSADRTVQ